jgi:Tfp pilus assembly protein PilO
MTLLQRVLAEKRNLVLALAIAAIGNVLLFALLVFPLGRQAVSAEQDAQVQREALRRARQDATAAHATVEGKQQADVALRKFYREVLPTNASSARSLTYQRLSQLARESNLRLERGTNVVKQEKGSSLQKVTTTYALTGDYQDVRQFIYSLETAPEFMVLENVALSAPEDTERALTVQLDVATYFRADNAG